MGKTKATTIHQQNSSPRSKRQKCGFLYPSSSREKIHLLNLPAAPLVPFLLFISLGILALATGISALTQNASAISVSDISGTDSAPVSVSVSNSPLAYYISVSSSHGSSSSPVNLSYTMDGSGNQLGNVVSSSDLVTIDTNSPMSHQLLLSTTSDNTTTKANNLVGDNTQEDTETGGLVPNTYIAPTSSTSLSTASSLSSNTWGFALDSNTPGIATNNFNTEAEYTSTDQTTQNTNKYTSVPAKNNEVLVLEDTTATSTTTIYYGVLADRSLPAGDYSNTILYTALAEQPSEIRVNPTELNIIDPKQTATIYTSINTTSDSLGNATVTFTNGTETGSCANPIVAADSDNYIYITCTSPDLKKGSYNINVTLDAFGRVLTGNNAISYVGTATIADITTMQQMTRGICQNTPESTRYDQYTLQDTRGSYNTTTPANYTVIKAKDNNCWMTGNLNLYDLIVTSENTDIPSSNYKIPATSDWGMETNTDYEAKVHRGTNINFTDQVYYNFAASTANIDGISITTDQDQSICPKNWTLPLYGNSDTDKSWARLFSIYDVTTGADLLSPTNNAYILGIRAYYGEWDYANKAEGFQSLTTPGGGRFWTGHVSDTYNNIAYYYAYYDSVQYFSNSKGYGFSIRCVAR